MAKNSKISVVRNSVSFWVTSEDMGVDVFFENGSGEFEQVAAYFSHLDSPERIDAAIALLQAARETL